MLRVFARALLPLVLCTCLSIQAHAQEARHTAFGSGGVDAANAALHLQGTIGQPIIGYIQTGNTIASQGFWCAREAARVSSAEPATGKTVATLICTPNPVSGEATVRLALHGSQNISLAIHNLLGKTVMHLIEDERKNGDMTLAINTAPLASGWYSLVLTTDNGRTVLPIRILR